MSWEFKRIRCLHFDFSSEIAKLFFWCCQITIWTRYFFLLNRSLWTLRKFLNLIKDLNESSNFWRKHIYHPKTTIESCTKVWWKQWNESKSFIFSIVFFIFHLVGRRLLFDWWLKIQMNSKLTHEMNIGSARQRAHPWAIGCFNFHLDRHSAILNRLICHHKAIETSRVCNHIIKID